MKTEEIKNNGAKDESEHFGCCTSENFQKMLEKMGKCCPGQDDSFDFSAMKGGTMKNMMEMCCGPKKTDTKEDTGSEKE